MTENTNLPIISENMSVVAKQPEAYYKVDKFSPEITLPPQDVLCSSYSAVSKSKSTIRFVVRSSGPRALLKSSVVCEIPLRITLVNQNNQSIDTRMGTAAATRVNQTVAPRYMGLERALASVQLSINNGVQLSVRPDQFCRLMEEWFYTNADDKCSVEGPRDSAPYGRKLGMAATGPTFAPLATHNLFEWQSKRDDGFARRIDMSSGGRGATTWDHTFRVEIPIGPFVKFARTPEDLGGRTRDSWIPYVNQFSLTLNFKPNPEAIVNLIQAQQSWDHANLEIDGEGGRPVGGILAHGALRSLQVPGHLSSFDLQPNTECRIHCVWCSPSSDVTLAPSYSFPCPRFLQYEEEEKIADGASKEFRFSAIKVEALPTFIVFTCQPRFQTDYHADDLPRTKFNNCGYQDTMNPLYYEDQKQFDENQQALTCTINERSSILSSFSVYELYRITKKNMQGRLELTFTEWARGDKQICVIRPADILQLENTYAPQTVTFRVRYGKNRLHTPDRVANDALQVCRMTFCYVDILTLAPGASSLSSFLVNESQIKRGGMESSASKLEDLALE